MLWVLGTLLPMARRIRQFLQLLFVVLLSALAGEGLAGAARGWAYPYLNVFQNDDVLGVRLQAGEHTRLRMRSGRTVDIHINSDGWRGATVDEVAAHPTRVLLLGDSQVFGYGVADDAPFARQMQALHDDVGVLNAGVPTYGPADFVAVAQDLVDDVKPTHVVVVFNVANDWFEAKTPNAKRTVASGGFAARLRHPNERDQRVRGVDVLEHVRRSHLATLWRQLQAMATRPMPQSRMQLLSRRGQALRTPGSTRTPLVSSMEALRRLCRTHGCHLTVVFMPLDVQADDAAWAKYADVVDVGIADTLGDDLRDDAVGLGLSFVDLRPSLRGASPGAFLDDDDHLSPEGHRVVAQTLLQHLLTQGVAGGGPS